MKPKYIFTAVVAVSLLMILVLPRLAFASPAPAAVQPGAAPTAVAAAPTQAPVIEQPAASEQPAAEPPPVVANETNDGDPESGGGRVASGESVSTAGIAVIEPPVEVTAAAAIPLTADPSSLESFAASLTNGQAGQLVGIYAAGQFALPVLQQPNGDENFVANVENTLTAYARSARHGTLGLLAHNTLSGSAFFNLKNGDEVVAVFGDGRQERYRITGQQAYQALSPNEPTSNFIDLSDSSQTIIGHEDVFNRVYAVSGRLVFQTCIEANSIPTWGRLFIIAERI